MIQIKRSELKKLVQDKLGNDSLESQNKVLVMISTSLAARTSYTVVGEEKEINYENMIALHDRLISQNPPHSSPMEHCARAMSNEEYNNFIKGVGYYDKNEASMLQVSLQIFDKTSMGWCRNFKGFIPYRHIIENN